MYYTLTWVKEELDKKKEEQGEYKVKRSRKRREEKEKRECIGGILGWGVTKPFVFLTPQLEAEPEERQSRGRLKKEVFLEDDSQVGGSVCVCVYHPHWIP